jgi:hypothetical protein
VLRVIAGMTFATLVLDLWRGGALLGRSPFSYSIVEAARYYGIGNEAAGALIGSGLVAAAAVAGWGTRRAGRPTGALMAALLGLLASGTLASPRLGADFGGFIAALVGFGTLTWQTATGAQDAAPTHQRRQGAGRAAIAAATLSSLLLIFVAGGFAAWDASRPTEQRTHIGQLLARVRGGDGGVGAAWAIVRRQGLKRACACLFPARGRCFWGRRSA